MTPEMNGKIRDYLLDRVSDVDREEIEKSMLTNDAAFEEVTIAESELVDDYLYGNLSPEDRLKVEQNFLNHLDTSQDLRFARALQRYIKSNPATPSETFRTGNTWGKRPWMLQAAALGVLAVLLGTILLVWTRRNQPERLVAVTLTLSTSERDQGATATLVRIPSNVDAVKFYLPIPDQNIETYTAKLVSATVEEGLKTTLREGQSVVVIVPTAQLSPGTYALQLQKQMPDGLYQRVPGSYFFKVE